MSWFEWRDAPKASFAVLGDPISQSRSPEMQMAALRELGRSDLYVALRVARGETGAAVEHLAALGYRGLNITTPLKEEAFALGYSRDRLCEQTGSVNTLDLIRRSACNTDGAGMVDVLTQLGCSPGDRVLLLGVGPAARACAFALHEANYRLSLWNRTESRACELAKALGADVKVMSNPVVEEGTIVINGTSVARTGEGLPIMWKGHTGLAIDMTYGGGSDFLTSAQELGLQVADGRWMLAAQGTRSLEFWLGEPVPGSAMRRALGIDSENP